AGTATNPDSTDTDMTVVRVNPQTGAMLDSPIFVANAGIDTASGVAVYHTQPHQDRIVVVGTATGQTDNDFAVARLNADGTLDTSFNAGSASHLYNIGGAGDACRAVAIDGSNNLVVAGSTT